MPDNDHDNNQNQQGGGRRNRGQGGGEKKDSFFEVASSRVIEEISRLAGRPLGMFISNKVLENTKTYARSGQLESAFRYLGPFLEAAYGDDEEIRGAIRGTFEGLMQGAKGATNDTAIAKVDDFFKNSPQFAKLEDLARQGRLEEARIIPYEEAFLKLSEPQQAVIEALVSRLNDKGEHLKSKFSAVGLQGVAKMLIVAKWVPAPVPVPFDPSAPVILDPMVERFRVRFSLAKTEVEKTFTGALGVVKAIEKQLKEEVKKGNTTGLSFEAELRARAGGISAGSNAMERARLRTKAQNSPSVPGPNWWQRLRARF